MWYYGFLQARSLQLPAGRHGAALEARYRLVRAGGGRVPRSIRVGERIRVLADSHGVASRFSSGPNMARDGLFNDVYRLVSPDPLPNDFRFEVEQTYTADGQPVTGKNKIVYLPETVMLYVFERGRWRLYGRGRGR